MRGYLSNPSNASAREQTERLKEEVSKREVELGRIEQEFERTYAECERQLGQKLGSERLPIGTRPRSAGK